MKSYLNSIISESHNFFLNLDVFVNKMLYNRTAKQFEERE